MYGYELSKLDILEQELEIAREKLHGPSEERQGQKVTVKTSKRHQNDQQTAINALNLQRHFMGSKGGSSYNEDFGNLLSSVVSVHETKRRRHGDPYIITRKIFFEGVVYQIEEEILSDDDNSSVYTSDDSYGYDKSLQMRFKEVNPSITEQADSVAASFNKPTGNLLKKLNAESKHAAESPILEEESKTPVSA